MRDFGNLDSVVGRGARDSDFLKAGSVVGEGENLAVA